MSNKKGADCSPTPQTNLDTSINSNTKSVKRGKRKRAGKSIKSPKETQKTLMLTFYAEQLQGVLNQDEQVQLQDALRDFGNNYDTTDVFQTLHSRWCSHISKLDSNLEVFAILHDKDVTESGVRKKPHYHLCVRDKNGKAFRVGTMLQTLGVYYRPGIDDSLWRKGVETCGSFSSCYAYLLHETSGSEGQHQYSYSELITNQSARDLQIMAEIALTTSREFKTQVPELMIRADYAAYDAGYNLIDFTDFQRTYPFVLRSLSSMKTVRESHTAGVTDRLAAGLVPVDRVCIFIEGAPNTGKSYSSRVALERLGKRTHNVRGGGTGKFDNLKASHDAILLEDCVCPNILNMTDGYVCHAYRRNRNNPLWKGDYFIVTSNDNILDWAEKSGLRMQGYRGSTSHRDALLSRFIVCRLEWSESAGQMVLVPTENSLKSLRGSDEQVARLLMKFRAFQAEFNNVIADYRPSANSATVTNASLMFDCLKEFASDELKDAAAAEVAAAEVAQAQSDYGGDWSWAFAPQSLPAGAYVNAQTGKG